MLDMRKSSSVNPHIFFKIQFRSSIFSSIFKTLFNYLLSGVKKIYKSYVTYANSISYIPFPVVTLL